MNMLANIGKGLWNLKTWILSIALGAYLVLNVENGLLTQWGIQSDINRLEAELEQYKQQFRDDTQALEELRNDPSVAVHVARERYLMKRENEDIYLFPQPSDSIQD